jgi:hypothetical protein
MAPELLRTMAKTGLAFDIACRSPDAGGWER